MAKNLPALTAQADCISHTDWTIMENPDISAETAGKLIP